MRTALAVLAALDDGRRSRRRPPMSSCDGSAWRCSGWQLAICSRLDSLEATVASISRARRRRVTASLDLVVPDGPPLAVIGMGKLGGNELNYASDIDVMFVGEGDPAEHAKQVRRLLDVVRASFRVDVDLRPYGRAGPLVRSLESFEAYWERWAEPWEFQALLKARSVAGDAELGAAFDESATARLWSRPFSADDLRALRGLKARSEEQLARRGLSDREVKRGRGGIRDIEFAVQLLQLVHGRLDPDLRSPTTLLALDELATAGYVDEEDARQLADAYRFLRRLEHRLQLRDGTAVYNLPVAAADRRRLARALGFRDVADGQRASSSSTPRWPAIRERCGRSTNGSTSARCSRRSPPRTRSC